jgi:hypothetical protein
VLGLSTGVRRGEVENYMESCSLKQLEFDTAFVRFPDTLCLTSALRLASTRKSSKESNGLDFPELWQHPADGLAARAATALLTESDELLDAFPGIDLGRPW